MVIMQSFECYIITAGNKAIAPVVMVTAHDYGGTMSLLSIMKR
jgi:hypothetical protein